MTGLDSSGYPWMPPHTCFGSADLIAACYPELRYAAGTLHISHPDGTSTTMRHAWCVHDNGQIIEINMRPLPGDSFRYDENPDEAECRTSWGWGAGTVRGDSQTIARAAAHLSPDAKRHLIEACGNDMAARLGIPWPEKENT